METLRLSFTPLMSYYTNGRTITFIKTVTYEDTELYTT